MKKELIERTKVEYEECIDLRKHHVQKELIKK